MSASRGVIRANNPAEFRAAFERIAALIRSPEVQAKKEEITGQIVVEMGNVQVDTQLRAQVQQDVEKADRIGPPGDSHHYPIPRSHHCLFDNVMSS